MIHKEMILNLLSSISINKNAYRRYVLLCELACSGKLTGYGYYEVHHILPRSLFPEYVEEEWNMIKVPGKLHYILHYLLAKFTQDRKMIHAFNCMRRLQCDAKPNCRLYAAYRDIFASNQRKRKHYYHIETKKAVFTFDIPSNDGKWVAGNLTGGNGKEKGYKFWGYNPITNECKVFTKKQQLPDGWINGRIMINNPFSKKRQAFYSMVKKTKEFSDIKEKHHCADPGKKVSDDTEVYVYEDKVTLSKVHLMKMFGSNNTPKSISELVIPKPHFNMNARWKEVCEKHHGCKLTDIGVAIIRMNDFIFNEETMEAI